MNDHGETSDVSGRNGQDPILIEYTFKLVHRDHPPDVGSSGLGLQALIEFAKQSENNIILVIGCRNPDNPSFSTALNGLEKIQKLDIFALDLAGQDSIRAFASRVLDTYPQQISVLLLCAGAILSTRSVDSSGIERTLQINAMSQALLLQCLWTRLVESGNHQKQSPRVVFVGSSMHRSAAKKYNVSPSSIEALLDNKRWKSIPAYSISKLVQMHLFQIVVEAFANVQANEPHPVAIAVSPGAKLIAQAMIDLDLKSGTYISPHGNESLAAECLDTPLRSAWRDWLNTKGVWTK